MPYLPSVFISFSLDNHYGYIHNLSPVKSSQNQNQWCKFDLHTSPSKLKQVAGFNIASHSMLQEYKESKTVVTLENTKGNSNNQIIFNQESMSVLHQPLILIMIIKSSINLKRINLQPS